MSRKILKRVGRLKPILEGIDELYAKIIIKL